MKTTLTISVNANGIDGYLFETEINLNDISSEGDILELLKTEALENESGEVTGYEIDNWQDVPEDWQTKPLSELIEIAEYLSNSSYDLEVWKAGIDCGIQPCDIDESYSGEYSSDEDFAQSTAEDLGYIKKEVQWPYTCIDWEHAARELMYDYCGSNGHYFRSI